MSTPAIMLVSAVYVRKWEYFVSAAAATQVPSTLISSSFQSVPLHEENLYLQQQQASSLKSGVFLEKVQWAKSNPPLLRTRLKRAAFCIAHLSREKQQLIEMVNRLRCQNTTAGLTGTLTDTLTSTQTTFKSIWCRNERIKKKSIYLVNIAKLILWSILWSFSRL